MLSRLAVPHGNARCLAFILALGLVAEAASAQVDDADRMQRCANNHAALQPIIAQLQLTYDDEGIARARQALVALRRIDVSDSPFRGDMDVGTALRIRNDRLQEIGRMVAVTCTELDLGCGQRMIRTVERRIDESVAALPARRVLEGQYQAYRNNMIALRCDQAANTSFTLAGTWTGSNGLSYEMGQSGNTIGWRVNSISETGRGTISGRSVAAAWNGNWGPGSATGTVSIGPGGVANRIDWNNGVVFSR